MVFIRKLVVYVMFFSIGSLAGLWLSGKFVDSRISVEGISIEKLAPQQVIEALNRNRNAIEQHTSLIVYGKRIVTVEGSWLMWAVVICPIIVCLLLAFLANKFAFDGTTDTQSVRGDASDRSESGSRPSVDVSAFGLCPNCNAKISLGSRECPNCRATFDPGSAWKVKPLEHT